MPTPSPTPDEGALRRLKKLLAMAMDGRGNPAEAENAMRMAQKLMAAHGLTEGALAEAEVDEFSYTSTKAAKPPPWEGELLRQLRRAFGTRHYWSSGKGPRGARSKGNWVVVGEKNKLELVRYAFDVIRRQLIKERSAFVTTLPVYYTRPRKALEADAFGLSFVDALSKKISDFSGQDPNVAAAIDKRITDACGGRKVSSAKVIYTSNAMSAGQAAGANANLHRPMHGAAAQLKIGR